MSEWEENVGSALMILARTQDALNNLKNNLNDADELIRTALEKIDREQKQKEEEQKKRPKLQDTPYGKKLCYTIALVQDGKTDNQIVELMKRRFDNPFDDKVTRFYLKKIREKELNLPPNTKKEDFL